MDEVIEEASKKYQGLVPLVYDIETMGLDEARPEDMQYAVYLKREADKVIAEKDTTIAELTEKNKRLEEFKAKYSGCAEKAINTIAKCELKIRSLSRALFKACANWAWAEHVRYVDISDGTEGYIHAQERWGNMASKCLKKKEAFK